MENVLPQNNKPTVLNSPPVAPASAFAETIATEPENPAGSVNNSLTNRAVVERGWIVRVILPTSAPPLLERTTIYCSAKSVSLAIATPKRKPLAGFNTGY